MLYAADQAAAAAAPISTYQAAAWQKTEKMAAAAAWLGGVHVYTVPTDICYNIVPSPLVIDQRSPHTYIHIYVCVGCLFLSVVYFSLIRPGLPRHICRCPRKNPHNSPYVIQIY